MCNCSSGHLRKETEFLPAELEEAGAPRGRNDDRWSWPNSHDFVTLFCPLTLLLSLTKGLFHVPSLWVLCLR